MKASEIDWYRFAYLYSEKGLELHEIVKAAYVFQVARIIEDDKDAYGYGILNNRGLYQAMIYAMIIGYPEGKTVSQADMARAMSWNRSTVSRLIKQMEKDGVLSYDRTSSTYEIHDGKIAPVPDWIIEFGKALIELQFNDELKETFDQEYEKFEFIRGFEVLWEELKQLKPLSRFRPSHIDD